MSANGEDSNLKAVRDPKYSLQRRLLDQDVQAANSSCSQATQSDWLPLVNHSTEYAPHDFLLPSSEGLASSLATFLRSAAPLVESVLESPDVFADEMLTANPSSSSSSSDTTLTLYDVTYTNGKRAQRVEWIDEETLIACYVSNESHAERMLKSVRPTEGHILIWNCKNELAPVAVLTAPSEVVSLKITRPKNGQGSIPGGSPFNILAGLINGQVTLWKDLVSKPVVSEIPFSHKGPVTGLAQISDTEFASCSADGKVFKWSIDDIKQPVKSCVLIRSETNTALGLSGVVVGDNAVTLFLATEEGEYATLQNFDKSTLTLSSSSTRMNRPLSAFSIADQDSVLLGVSEFGAFIWQAGVLEPLWSSAPVNYSTGCFGSEDGSVLVLGRADGNLEIWDFDESSLKPVDCVKVSTVGLVSVSKSDGRLAIGDENGRVHVLKWSRSGTREVSSFFPERLARLRFLEGVRMESSDAGNLKQSSSTISTIASELSSAMDELSKKMTKSTGK